MVTLPIFDKTGSEVGNLEVDTQQIASRVNKQLLHDAVVMYQANLRQGSAKTKSRAEVAGTRQKMYRQKGTGNARAGHRSSGIRRSGGHIFAKRPRDFSYRLNKKSLRLATRMAFASRINDDEITVIDALAFESPKTRDMAAILKALQLDGMKAVLVAIEDYDVNVYKSLRNIEGVTVLPISQVNALELLKPRRVLVTKAALESFIEKCKSEPAKAVEEAAAE